LSLIAELKRRNVIKVAVAYLALGWVVVQVTSTVGPLLHLPEWIAPVVVWIGVIGFPFVAMFSWIYELTPEGLKRESEVDRTGSITHVTGRRLDHLIVGLLVIAIGLFAFHEFHGGTTVPAAGPPSSAATAAPPSATVPATQDQSIAVLPFVDMSQAKDQEYFADGLSEELLNLLAQVPQLRVIARTSSFSFRGKEVDVATIARTLKVANVLEGSVRKSGDTLRITAQLIRASDSSHLWSQTYDRQMTDVFKVQDEIAGAVVAALKVKLLPAQQVTNPHRTSNTEAYNQYLLGNQFFNRTNPDGFRSAVTAYRQAVALDPGFAAAYAALAFAEGFASDYAATASELAAGQQRALAAADKAVSLAPGLADGYAARAWFRAIWRWDWAGAQADYERALALEPANIMAQRGYASLLGQQGRLPEAIAALRKAVELDPLSSLASVHLGEFLLFSGQSREAREVLDRALSISPESSFAHFALGCLELMQGRAPEALTLFRGAGDAFRQAGVAVAEHSLGHAAESQQALDELIAKYSHESAYQIAEVYAWRGEPDRAFEWLDRAYAQHDGGLGDVKIDQLFAGLRMDARYAAILKKVGLTP